jgi:hypothetical protein
MTFDKIIQFVYFLISCTIFNNFDLSLLEISYIPVVFIWWRRAGVDTRLGASVPSLGRCASTRKRCLSFRREAKMPYRGEIGQGVFVAQQKHNYKDYL